MHHYWKFPRREGVLRPQFRGHGAGGRRADALSRGRFALRHHGRPAGHGPRAPTRPRTSPQRCQIGEFESSDDACHIDPSPGPARIGSQ